METTQEKPVEEAIVEVPVLVETCDKCGAGVKATHEASKDGLTLFFCGHHIRDLSDKLKADGFSITPEYIGY